MSKPQSDQWKPVGDIAAQLVKEALEKQKGGKK